jgi:hypothetical protein
MKAGILPSNNIVMFQWTQDYYFYIRKADENQ